MRSFDEKRTFLWRLTAYGGSHGLPPIETKERKRNFEDYSQFFGRPKERGAPRNPPSPKKLHFLRIFFHSLLSFLPYTTLYSYLYISYKYISFSVVLLCTLSKNPAREQKKERERDFRPTAAQVLRTHNYRAGKKLRGKGIVGRSMASEERTSFTPHKDCETSVRLKFACSPTLISLQCASGAFFVGASDFQP
jgi:hypothetical protein